MVFFLSKPFLAYDLVGKCVRGAFDPSLSLHKIFIHLFVIIMFVMVGM